MTSSSVRSRMQRRILILTAITLTLMLLAYFGVAAYVVSQMTLTNRRAIVSNPQSAGMNVEDVTFPSLDSEIDLSGWLLRPTADQGRVVVVVHGHNGARDDQNTGMFEIEQGLVAQGFSVLAFDLRGSGTSEGERFSLAYFEQNDVLGAIRFAQSRGFKHIGLLGYSMGAASSLLAAAQEPSVKAVVEDSAYANLMTVLDVEIPKRSKLPAFFTPGVVIMARVLYGIDTYAVKPAEAAARLSPRPLLVIHGTADQLIAPSDAELIWHARYGAGSPDPATLMLVPGAGHTQAFNTDRSAYLKAVGTFFERHLR